MTDDLRLPWRRETAGHRAIWEITGKVDIDLLKTQIDAGVPMTDATWIVNADNKIVAFVGNGPRQTENAAAIIEAVAGTEAYRRLAVDGTDVDQHLYLTDPIYKAIVTRIRYDAAREWREALSVVAWEGRNLVANATDEQAAVIERWASELLGIERDPAPASTHVTPSVPDTIEAVNDPMDELIEVWLRVSEQPPLAQHFSHGRLKIVGPWQFQTGWKWQALAEPYNGDGSEGNSAIEAIGATFTEAVRKLTEILKGYDR